jgi:hypothetical protein
VPKFVSPADPAAQWTGAHKGHAFFAYAANYLIDLKTAVIVDVEATRAIRQAEVGAARTMIERTANRFGLKPKRLAADSAYGSAPSLDWLVKTKIAPHIPVLDKSRRDDGTFSRSDFQFDGARNVYVCPAAKTLTTRGTIVSDDQVLYRASKFDCTPCPLKSRCCPKEPVRKIPRSIFEQSRDVVRSLVGTELYERSRRERKKIEMLFAHLKRIIGLRRLRLRGPTGAKDEFLLAHRPEPSQTRQADRPGNPRTPRGSVGTSHRKGPAMPVASQLRSFSTISAKRRHRHRSCHCCWNWRHLGCR